MYNARGPHHLWHNDGHHKLIRYELITHGCVDGNTRTIIYLGKTYRMTCVSLCGVHGCLFVYRLMPTEYVKQLYKNHVCLFQ